MENAALRRLFEKALEIGGGTHTIDDIENGVAAGFLQFWHADDCCAVTEIIAYPRAKKLHVFIAAGKFESICSKLLPQARQFAIDNGCVAMTTIGRKGFMRRIPEYGFKPKFVAYEYDLKGNDDG